MTRHEEWQLCECLSSDLKARGHSSSVLVAGDINHNFPYVSIHSTMICPTPGVYITFRNENPILLVATYHHNIMDYTAGRSDFCIRINEPEAIQELHTWLSQYRI